MTKLDFFFGEIFVHDNYIIAVMKEGITVTPDLNDVLFDIVTTYFHSKPFVYITNRINSYSVNPIIYKSVSLIETLKAFAVVSKTLISVNVMSNSGIFLLIISKP